MITVPSKNKYYVVLMVLILFFSTRPYQKTVYRRYFNPPMREHIRPTLKYISDNIQEEDTIYVYYGSIAPFRFYNKSFGFDRFINGELPRRQQEFENQFNSLNGRIWILFSHMNHKNAIDYIYSEIDKHQIIDQFDGVGSKSVLVNFDNNNIQ